MNDYKPNSHRFKEEQKQQAEREKKFDKPVVTTPVKVKKKGELSKMADTFISEDAKNIKSYILMDVVVPAVKKLVSDIVRDGIDMLLYGEKGRSKNSSTGASYISYKNSYNGSNTTNNNRVTRYSSDEIIIDHRGEAEEVLARMKEALDEYGEVSVADFYDLIQRTAEYTDHNYGWRNLDGAYVDRVRDGYKIIFPRAISLK